MLKNCWPLKTNIDCDKNGIYAIICTKTWRGYIGSTGVGLSTRIDRHLRFLKEQKANKEIQRDFNLYGASDFKVELLEEVENEKMLLERENYWMNYGCNLYNKLHGWKRFPDISYFSEEYKKRFWSKINIRNKKECWFKKDYKVGNRSSTIRFNGEKYLTHRISYYLEFGQQYEHLLACHTCNNKACCNPYHIYFGSYQDNSKDLLNQEGFCKLNWEIVKFIREEYPKHQLSPLKEIQKQLKNKYDIKIGTPSILRIIENKRWVDDKYIPTRTLPKIESTYVTQEIVNCIRELHLSLNKPHYTQIIQNEIQDRFGIVIRRQEITRIVKKLRWK